MNFFDFLSFYIVLTRVSIIEGFTIHSWGKCRIPISSLNSQTIDVDIDDDDEDAEIGTMRVSELKSELSLRGIDFSDCFDKESLAIKLRDARASGKADPTIIDQFNKQRV